VNAVIFRLARKRFPGLLIAWMISKMSFLIPVDRLYNTAALMAFHHPQPAYPFHILIVPKREIRSLSDIRAEDQDFLQDLFKCTRVLAAELKLDECGYRLIANGGQYQDLPLLHFHLISEDWTPERR
jgi:histidine triad (HIT) family protein